MVGVVRERELQARHDHSRAFASWVANHGIPGQLIQGRSAEVSPSLEVFDELDCLGHALAHRLHFVLLSEAAEAKARSASALMAASQLFARLYWPDAALYNQNPSQIRPKTSKTTTAQIKPL